MKKRFIFLVALFVMCAFVGGAVMPLVAQAETAVKDVNNKICPVCGNKVSGMDFATYEGKKYGLCCANCAKQFNADPAKYAAKCPAMEATAVKGG